jgi:hypothetical protein
MIGPETETDPLHITGKAVSYPDFHIAFEESTPFLPDDN